MKLSFCIPGNPVPKGRPRLGAGGHAYTPAKTRNYERHVYMCAMAAVSKARGWRKDWGSYAMVLRIFREKAIGDADNFGKACMDGAHGVLYDDDVAVRDIRIIMDDDPIRPRTEVEIEMLDNETLEQRRKRISAQRRRAANG